MAKKKKKASSAQSDDFLEQLLKEAQDIAADEGLTHSGMDDEVTVSGAEALGLSPTGYHEEASESVESSGDEVWGALEVSVGSEESSVVGPQFESAKGHENEKTYAFGGDIGAVPSLEGETNHHPTVNDHDATVAASGFARGPLKRAEPQEKVVIGSLRGARAGHVMTSMDASLAQAESLKIAQQRILDLEAENDRLRQENEEISSAADVIRTRLEELGARMTSLEKEKEEAQEIARNEAMILKGNLQYKESEVAKSRMKIEELENRLRADFKKIRVKERELENRLELARAEKSALVRAKDDHILDLKRKTDQLQSEIDNYRDKCLELNKTIEAQQDQFKRTVRALRLALTNLESKEQSVVSLKKAE